MTADRIPFAAPQRIPIGTYVKTPLGRLAKVLGYDDDGRAHLAYQDCARPRDAPVDLMPHLLTVVQ